MTQRQLETYADKFVKRLGLSEWSIRWDWIPEDTFGDGNHGQVHWNVPQMYARITIASDRPAIDVCRTIRHELVHLSMAHLHEAEKAVLKQSGGCGSCATWLDIECEKATDRIARAFDEEDEG